MSGLSCDGGRPLERTAEARSSLGESLGRFVLVGPFECPLDPSAALINQPRREFDQVGIAPAEFD